MGTPEDRSNQMLMGVIAVLVAALLLAACAAIYSFRQAEEARAMAEASRMEAVHNVQREVSAREALAAAERLSDSQSFFARFYRHIVGAQPLSEAEWAVVRPSIAGDAEMAPVLEAFDADMAAVNQLLGPDRQVHNYHEAIAACRELLEKEAN